MTRRRHGAAAIPPSDQPTVLLLSPRHEGPQHPNYFAYRPLALLSMAGIARRAGWRPIIADEDIVDLPEVQPDLVGITVWTQAAPRAYALAAGYREQGIPVVMGGAHASLLPNEVLGFADAVVVGEGESCFGRLLDDVANGRLESIYQGEFLEMDAVPPVNAVLDLYSGPPYEKTVLRTFQTTRGCRYNCDFCSVIRLNGRSQRHLDPEAVVDQLSAMQAASPHQRGPMPVHFVNDDLASDLDYAWDLCAAIARSDLDLHWSTQTSIGLARHPDLLDLANRSGLRQVYIGLESVSREALLEVNKKNRPHEFAERIAALHDHRVSVAGGFIVGLDSDRADVFEETAVFADRIGVDVAVFSVLTPYPGTATFAQMYEGGRLTDFDWAHYNGRHVVFRHAHLSTAEIEAGVLHCHDRFYSRRRQVARVARMLRHTAPTHVAGNAYMGWIMHRHSGAQEGSPILHSHVADPDDLDRAAAASRVPADEAMIVAAGQVSAGQVSGRPIPVTLGRKAG